MFPFSMTHNSIDSSHFCRLNDAMFGDESDDEAKVCLFAKQRRRLMFSLALSFTLLPVCFIQGADVKYAYKPNAKVQQDISGDESEASDVEANDQDSKPAASSSKKKLAASKPSKSKDTGGKKRKRSQGNSTDQWRCGKCGNMCEGSKKRCGVRTCQVSYFQTN